MTKIPSFQSIYPADLITAYWPGISPDQLEINDSVKDLFELSGTISIHHLADLPLEMPAQVTIAALSPRKLPALSHVHLAQEPEIIRIQRTSFSEAGNSVELTDLPPSTSTASPKISILELTPRPGAGILAIVCDREDISTRKQLMKYHHHDTALLSNEERLLAKCLATHGCKEVGIRLEHLEHRGYQLALCIRREDGSLWRWHQRYSTFADAHEYAWQSLRAHPDLSSIISR